MMSGNDLFHSCWDNEPSVSLLSFDGRAYCFGTVQACREFVKANPDVWFNCCALRPEETISLPDVCWMLSATAA